MKFYIYKRPNGEEIELRFTTQRIVEAEQRTGKSISELVSEMDKISCASEIVAGAIGQGDYVERMNKALDLFDEIVENGGTLIDYQLIAMEILKNAGFMTAQKVELVKKAAKAEERLLSKSLEISQN